MSKNRLMKFFPILFALLLVFSVSLFAVVAEETSEAVESSEDVSAADTAENSVTDTSSSESAVSETSAEASTETSTEDSSSTTSTFPWKLVIAIGVIVVVIAVLFILAKTNTALGQKIAKFFKDYKSELKKIVWMPWKDLLKATGITLVVLVAAGVLIGLLDFGFSSLLKLLS